jgi:hypothetical protein
MTFSFAFRICALVVLFSPRLPAQTAWTSTRTNLSGVNYAHSIAFGNGRFVVTLSSNSNTISPAAAWSTDGLTWRAANLTFPTQGSVAFVAGAFYLAGSSGIWRSIDGDTWQRIYTAPNTNVSFRGIATDGRGLLVGQSTISATTLYYSSDLVTWRPTATLPNAGPPNLQTSVGAVSFVNGRYYVLYDVMLPNFNLRSYGVATVDGSQWTDIPRLGSALFLAGGNGRLVAGSGGIVLGTMDGTTFSSTPVPVGISNGGTMGFAGGRYFFLGSLQASLDGISWGALAAFTQVSSANGYMTGIAYGNGRYVAVGYSGGISAPSDSIIVLAANAPPIIITGPGDRTMAEGGRTTFSVVLDNPGMTATYQWRRDGNTIPSATAATFVLDPVKATDGGRYSVEVRNVLGTATSDPASLVVVPPSVAPTITAAPASATVLAGAAANLSVTAGGTPPFAYQWLRDGTPIAGATGATFKMEPVLPADGASYSVTVTNASGSVTSTPVALSVTPISRISNLSVLTTITGAGDNLTVGYVVGGTDTIGGKPVVLRAAGPSLASVGVASVLEDPRFELFTGPIKTGENDNWGGSPSLAAAFAEVGAFSYHAPSSRDAGALANLAAGGNSMLVTAADGRAGVVIAEVYDASPSDSFTSATPRLVNVSVRKSIRTTLTVGFTIFGTNPKTVLIRAIGPTLGIFGISDAAPNPQLALHRSGIATPLTNNDDWSGTIDLARAFSAVGAFPLDPTSKDAALLATLTPGGYSVQVSGVNGTAGEALVEVYEVQ